MLDATPLVRMYARRRRAVLAAEDAVAAQEQQLLRLVSRASNTEFGRAHDFARIGSVADFQRRVPLRRYEDFWRDWWQPRFPRLADATWPGPIPFLALSSGTTAGRTKYIPVSPAMRRSNARAALDVIVHHLSHRPRSRMFGGKIFMLGGSTALKEEAPGVASGDLSGIAAKSAPIWSRPFAFPPADVALMADWDAKVAACIAGAAEADIRCITGTPSWLLILFERHAAATGLPMRARDLYPNLELIVHGGVNFAPYRRQFETFVESSHAELREVYPASEGFIAVADDRPEAGLRLIADNGLFFEFVPVEDLESAAPRRRWLKDLELNRNHALVVTSCAGLWSYVLGDTVKLISRRPPRLLVTGRTSYTMSAFGEHLTGAEVEDAIATATHEIDAHVVDYAMGAIFPQTPGTPGGHLFIVEFAVTPADATVAAFGAALDRRLSELNDDYRAHRADGFGMAAPRITAVCHGFFAEWMRRRGKLGGQYKVPRIINDEILFADLRRAAGAL
jgi:hypothetical protein